MIFYLRDAVHYRQRFIYRGAYAPHTRENVSPTEFLSPRTPEGGSLLPAFLCEEKILQRKPPKSPGGGL